VKNVAAIYRSDDAHCVGDGFQVRTIFSPQTLGERISPFLLLDYAGPAEFEPTNRQRGVEQHPHRAFETVTNYVTKQMLEKVTSNGKTWPERLNGADIMTKHNAYSMG